MSSMSTPLAVVLDFVASLEEKWRTDLKFRIVSMEDHPNDRMALFVAGRVDELFRHLFRSTDDPLLYVGRVLKLRTFLDYEFSYFASDEFIDEQERFFAMIAAKTEQPPSSFKTVRESSRDRSRYYKSRLDDWRRIVATDLSDHAIRQHSQRLWRAWPASSPRPE